MSKPKRPLKVFLCHAHADRDPVRGLYTRLTQDGVDAWLDKAKLLPGQDWELEIRKAVREADVVVVCLSKQFNQAGFRQKEVRLALDTAMEKPEGEIFVIPARLEECDTLESLRRWHWVDLFEEDGYEMLMRALRTRANTIGVTLQIKNGWLPKINLQPEHAKQISLPVKEFEKKKLEASKSKNKIQLPNIIFGVVGFVILGFVLTFGLPPLLNVPEPDLPPTNTLIANTPLFVTVTKIQKPSESPVIPTITQTLVFTPTPIPLPTEIRDTRDVPMMFVAGGQFLAGNENPLVSFFLNDYYIDKYEVTNALFDVCVKAGECKAPAETRLASIPYYVAPEYRNFPVVWVNLEMAKQYCDWRGARLPTGLEWEKAARGTDGRIYPWGNLLGIDPLANFCDLGAACYIKSAWKINDQYALTSPVDSFEAGKSPYGVYNMAGNVREWVSDEGDYKYKWTVGYTRGGSWFETEEELKTYLQSETSNFYGYDHGFRCATDAP